jgi:hypothetical protein
MTWFEAFEHVDFDLEDFVEAGDEWSPPSG